VAIEPLHSSKLLMCAQSAAWGCVREKEQERRGMRERGKEGGREGKEMSRLPCFAWRIKREGKLTAGSIWSFGYPATRQLHPTPADVHITLKD